MQFGFDKILQPMYDSYKLNEHVSHIQNHIADMQ